MCTTCGCSPEELLNHAQDHDGHDHSHPAHEHNHSHGHLDSKDRKRTVIAIEEDILAKNNRLASFDLGEQHKVVVLSTTEGEDKPLKYPQMFHNSSVMLLNKTDLLPHLDFDMEKCKSYARRVNPALIIFEVSARTGQGMEAWYRWLGEGVAR